MTEENTPPEICKKYDSLVELIQSLESDIESLENKKESKIETVKEYIQILKDGYQSGLKNETWSPYKDSPHGDIKLTKVTESELSYFEMKIKEINEELTRNDEATKNKINELSLLECELEKVEKEILDCGWWKVQTFLCSPEWYSIDKARERLANWGSQRIV